MHSNIWSVDCPLASTACISTNTVCSVAGGRQGFKKGVKVEKYDTDSEFRKDE